MTSGRRLFSQTKWRWLILLIFLLVFGPYLSWPGIAPNFLFQLARADETPLNQEIHDYQAAYAFLSRQANSSEPILVQNLREYYLADKTLNYQPINVETDDFTLAQLQDFIKQNPAGWIVWPKYKEYHLSSKVVNYCQKNLQSFPEIKETNLKIYHWDNSLVQPEQ